MIEDVVTLVKGGITDSGSGLLAIRNPDTYRHWGATLKYNPALIEYEVTVIFSDLTQHALKQKTKQSTRYS